MEASHAELGCLSHATMRVTNGRGSLRRDAIQLRLECRKVSDHTVYMSTRNVWRDVRVRNGLHQRFCLSWREPFGRSRGSPQRDELPVLHEKFVSRRAAVGLNQAISKPQQHNGRAGGNTASPDYAAATRDRALGEMWIKGAVHNVSSDALDD